MNVYLCDLFMTVTLNPQKASGAGFPFSLETETAFGGFSLVITPLSYVKVVFRV